MGGRGTSTLTEAGLGLAGGAVLGSQNHVQRRLRVCAEVTQARAPRLSSPEALADCPQAPLPGTRGPQRGSGAGEGKRLPP